MAEWSAAQAGPRVPGGAYTCGYWQAGYQVEAMWSDMAGTLWVRVRWDVDGHVTVHCTPWDAHADRVA
jgi:hypothetical protein